MACRPLSSRRLGRSCQPHPSLRGRAVLRALHVAATPAPPAPPASSDSPSLASLANLPSRPAGWGELASAGQYGSPAVVVVAAQREAPRRPADADSPTLAL